MSIRIKDKNGFEKEYIRIEQSPHAKLAEKDTTVKRKDETKVEYVHSSQVGKEEMQRLLRQAEIRETIARNEKIEKRIEERIQREAKKEKKKRDAEQQKQARLALKRNKTAISDQRKRDWLDNIKAVQYLGVEVVGGGTAYKYKKGSAVIRSLIGSSFGPVGAFLGAASAVEEKQIPEKVFHRFFILYKDGRSKTITVREDTKKFHDLMTLYLNSED